MMNLLLTVSHGDFSCPASRRAGDLQFHGHAGAAIVDTAAAPHAAAMELHDLTTHVQADAGPAWMPAIVQLLVLDTKELVEDARAKWSRHARTGVDDVDRDRFEIWNHVLA